MNTLHGVRKWAASAAITARSTARIRACVAVGIVDVATGVPVDVAGRAEQAVATSALPSCCS
ncbi:hypothetical protein [Rhodococcus sp. ACT016]|uniref:hypothetical protein n=1 Tax=Rhodococcus sp. ACT016 TaxID=3134808 RepID=UPI003D2952B8